VALFLVAIAIPTFLGVTHSGPSVENLDYSVQSQITGSGPGEFNATGVTGVDCNPPSRWTAGTTFTCVAYGPGNDVVGNFYGTVANAPTGRYLWFGRYSPSAG
jgi:hypothetical protein